MRGRNALSGLPPRRRRVPARQVVAGVALAVAGLCMGPPAAAAAQDQASSVLPFEGYFVLIDARAEHIDDALRKSVAGANRFLRPFMLRRMRSIHLSPPDALRFATDRAKAVVTIGELPPIVAEPGGEPVYWRRSDIRYDAARVGERIRVRVSVAGDRLRHRYLARDGFREETFSLSPDGRVLTMEVHVETDRLFVPIAYRVVYGRVQ